MLALSWVSSVSLIILNLYALFHLQATQSILQALLQMQHQHLWCGNTGLLELNITGVKHHNCITMYANSSQTKTGNSGLKNLENVQVYVFRAAEYDIVYSFDNCLEICI